MRTIKTLGLSFCVSISAMLLCAMLSPRAKADEWNKKSIVTFHAPVEIPGKALPAGTYVFKLLNSPSDRHIVQIWNEDETHLIATVMANPEYRFEPAQETILNFDERPGDSPMALASWFYPGDTIGQQFVYPDWD
jgi:hypothetical protein